jgi:cilia- and flagella-associated protein 57
MNLQGVSVTPKFVYGINGNIKNCLFYLDDKRLLYLAGHNMVIFNVDDPQQSFIAASEGTAGVNHIAMSHTKRYLAICEKGKTRA